MRLRCGVLLSGVAAMAVVLLAGCTSGDGTSGGGTAASTPTSAPAVPAGPRTSAVFTPRRTATEAELRETAEQLRKRATVLGLVAPQVEAGADGTITLTAANTTQSVLTGLATQGELAFRPVLAVAASAPAVAGAPVGEGTAPPGLAAGFLALDCAQPEQRVDHQTEPTAQALACSRSMATGGVWEKLALGPVAVDGKNVRKAESALDPQNSGRWQILLTFDDTGAKAFADVTGRLSTQDPPTNQFAIVVDGLVVSHPAVLSAITGGSAVITGSFTQDDARRLAVQLSDHLTVPLAPAGLTTSAG